MPDLPPDDLDPIRELREQIRATREAAERLAEESANGFGERTAEHAEEVQALAAVLQSLRDLIPAELEAQFREVLRQVLLLVRALIDWWVERIEPDATATRPSAVPDIHDIPID